MTAVSHPGPRVVMQLMCKRLYSGRGCSAGSDSRLLSARPPEVALVVAEVEVERGCCLSHGYQG